jgi:hypothetical protein
VNERILDLLDRRPALVAVVSVLTGLMVFDASRRTGANGHTSSWSAYAAMGLVVVAITIFAASYVPQALAGPRPGLLRWALAWSPVTGAVFVLLTGGAEWAAWTSLGASCLLFTAYGLTTQVDG